MKPHYELRPYQIDDVAYYINNPKCMNLSDPGTGKTPGVCAYMGDYLWTHKNVKTVWAMPKSLLGKNRDELLRFSHLRPDQVVVVDGTPEQRRQQMESGAVVFLMGFQRLSEDWNYLLSLEPNLKACIVDELHLGYGGPESRRTINWWRFMRKMWYFIGMTGTFIDGRLDSAYPVIQVITPHIYGNHEVFKNRHAVIDYSSGRIVDWQNHAMLAQVIGQFSIRHTFEEVYGEKNMAVNVIDCFINDGHQAVYDDMEREALVDLGDDWLEAVNDGVKAIRCRQILAHPETFGFDFGETEKDRRVRDFLNEAIANEKPLIIFSAIIPELKRIVAISKEMGLSTAMIDGTVGNRAELDEDFRNGKYQIMCATPATAGVGFNWEHVDTMLFVSIDYKDSNWDQAIMRSVRGKRDTTLMVHLLCYQGTVENKIIKSIERKSKTAHKVDSTHKMIEIVTRDTKREQQTFKTPEAPASGMLSMGDMMDEDED